MEETKNIQMNVDWNKVSESKDSGKFVRLPENEDEKVILITAWQLQDVEKFGGMKTEFSCTVLEEDELPVKEKVFSTMSNRLLNKLKDVLEDKKPTEQVKLSIIKMADGYDTKYRVKKVD